MTKTTLTEQYVIDTLLSTARDNGETAPRAIIVQRDSAYNSITRTVRVGLVISINNETLLDALIRICIKNDMLFWFTGSETNLQLDMEVDYLYFDFKVMAKEGD